MTPCESLLFLDNVYVKMRLTFCSLSNFRSSSLIPSSFLYRPAYKAGRENSIRNCCNFASFVANGTPWTWTKNRPVMSRMLWPVELVFQNSGYWKPEYLCRTSAIAIRSVFVPCPALALWYPSGIHRASWIRTNEVKGSKPSALPLGDGPIYVI